MLEWVRFVAVFPVDYWFCEGVLFIKAGLPAEEKSEIIRRHLTEANPEIIESAV